MLEISSAAWFRSHGEARAPSSVEAADAAATAYASYHNHHRLHGQLGWHTPAERFDGTPFAGRGFEHVPALAGVADLLAELLATAA